MYVDTCVRSNRGLTCTQDGLVNCQNKDNAEKPDLG